ncbi:Crp/Fnr family transcriptional regulator [uncultured Enterovirga sp.]|uniref:Crp/Fnr family transcriptional regulator n=1 Tax=uncultured Enterovirga sp. TaxID=2026352 RepID=UPI0035C9441F
MTAAAHNHPLVRKLESIFALSEDEKSAIAALPMRVAALGADQDIAREGDSPSHCCLILGGYAAVTKLLLTGQRQITAFQIAGDMPDLLSLHLETMDSGISTLTPCQVAFIEHKAIRDLCRQFPRITDALWRATLIEASIFKEWIANVGQRTAYPRLAHLLCETLVRSEAVGLAEDHTCEFPVTQRELGEATGMTEVHVNRTLKALKDAGLISLNAKKLQATDWAGLKGAGQFDAGYLHLAASKIDQRGIVQ